MASSSILLFKPDARYHTLEGKNGQYPLHEIGKGLLVAAGLEIAAYTNTRIEPNDVRRMYARALRPNPQEDALYGTQWKEEVVDHISSGPLDAYLVSDPDMSAGYKTKLIKNLLRSTFSKPDNVVQNIAHVPDEDEFELVRSILF